MYVFMCVYRAWVLCVYWGFNASCVCACVSHALGELRVDRDMIVLICARTCVFKFLFQILRLFAARFCRFCVEFLLLYFVEVKLRMPGNCRFKDAWLDNPEYRNWILKESPALQDVT